MQYHLIQVSYEEDDEDDAAAKKKLKAKKGKGKKVQGNNTLSSMRHRR